MKPLGSGRPRSDRPARTSPAAQPSVRSASRATSSAASARPIEPFSSSEASSSVNCNSPTRSSASSPRARILAKERRVDPGRQHHMHISRKMVQEQAEGLVADRVGHHVVVVQHQHQRPAHRAQVVDQRRHHHPLQLHARAAQRLQGDGPHPRLDGPQRRHQIAPEAGRVVVALIQRHPSHPPATSRLAPLGEQGRLAGPGRRGQQAQLGLQAGLEHRLETSTGNQPGARGRRRQLGPHQLRIWRADRVPKGSLDRGTDLGSIHHNPGRQSQHTTSTGGCRPASSSRGANLQPRHPSGHQIWRRRWTPRGRRWE